METNIGKTKIKEFVFNVLPIVNNALIPNQIPAHRVLVHSYFQINSVFKTAPKENILKMRASVLNVMHNVLHVNLLQFVLHALVVEYYKE